MHTEVPATCGLMTSCSTEMLPRAVLLWSFQAVNLIFMRTAPCLWSFVCSTSSLQGKSESVLILCRLGWATRAPRDGSNVIPGVSGRVILGKMNV